MTEIIIPSVEKDPNLPLYVAVGLTSKESDTVYFTVKELLTTGKTNAEILKIIAENPRWNSTMKVWGAYNLHREILKQKLPPGIKWMAERLDF